MNSAHDTKEWHSMSQAPLQNPILAESPVSQSSQIQHYPMDHHYGQSFQPQGPPMQSPVHHQLPANNFVPTGNGKSESDPRLPGMMALSQPSTPRPSQHSSPTSKKAHANYTTSSFHAAPYPHPALARKRGRNELFSTELGPFFSSTKPFDNLYALNRSTLLTIRIQAKMDRGFFLADDDWTCYRRNYFQVSGAFAIHGLNHYYTDQETQCLVQVDGVFHPVHSFSMNISARVSNSDKKIELVQHTPKRDKGPQSTPNPKLITPGGNLGMSSVGANQSIVTFERIQFKTATANNGKRRAAQQYYVCLVDLYAEIEGSKKVKIASCQSAPLVVRGRSPGHYSDNHERYENSSMSMSTASTPQPQDERFSNGSFSRPPMTPPGMMNSEYGSSYPYQPYSNYSPFNPMSAPLQPTMMMNSNPPTPTTAHPHHHQQNHHTDQPNNPQNNGGSYMVPSMSSGPSASESSSPDLYNNDYNGNGSALHEDAKLNHSQQLPHPHHHHPINGMHMSTTPMEQPHNSWPRSRMNSTGSHQSPAAVYEQHNSSYFPQQHQNGAYGSASSTPYGGPQQRKYNPQQQAS